MKGHGDADVMNVKAIVERIRWQVKSGNIRITLHAHQEMVEEEITLAELREAFSNGEILENYPYHRRGACCLIWGHRRRTAVAHSLHDFQAGVNHHYRL